MIALRVVLTVTVFGIELKTYGVIVPASVAITLNIQEPGLVGVFEIMTLLPPISTIVFVPTMLPLHTRLTVNGPTPVPTGMFTVYVTVCARSMLLLDGDMPTVGCGLIVKVRSVTEFAVFEVVAASVMITFAPIMFPGGALGITHANVLVVVDPPEVIPVYCWLDKITFDTELVMI
jgi:hypothetical protein